MQNNLYRDEHRKMIGGVCAGLSDYFKVEPSIVRLIFLLALILKGGGLLIYIVLWIVLPKKDNANPIVSSFTQPPLDTTTFMPVKKSPSTFAIAFGLILILFGAYFLLDNYNLLPDWDFENLWPLGLVVIGLVLIFVPKKNLIKQPHPWEKTAQSAAAPTEPTETTENPETI